MNSKVATWMYCFAILLLLVFSGYIATSHATRGIYLTQSTAMNTPFLEKLIKQSKFTGINTFIIDVNYPSEKYAKNIKLIQFNNINYVARIVLFPGGASEEDVDNQALLENRYQLMDYAIKLGAKEIQLDYVRYKPNQEPSEANAKKINNIIKTFHDRLAKKGIPLNLAVFGVAAFKPSNYIGQDLQLFSKNSESLSPMLYPSHFTPYQYYSARPYQTIHEALKALETQLHHKKPVKVYAYIEASNYHYLSMPPKERVAYISQEIQAVKDAKADGFYVWSANNNYTSLFNALEIV